MATGREMQLTKQVGEYLVAAELCRRGFIATTFTGNVPYYDIIASNKRGKHITVQVKTISGKSWQIGNISKLVDITFEGHKQIVGDVRPAPVQNLVYVFVKLGDYGNDRFFLSTWRELAQMLAKNHTEWLAQHDGVRPRNWESLHTAFSADDISQYEDRWDLIENMLDW